MAKIILNKCYGGYGWSEEATFEYLDRLGKDYKCFDYDDNELTKEEYLAHGGWGYIKVDGKWFDGIGREDPIAIALLEEKGSEYCSGSAAELVIKEYDKEDWIAKIDEYDGCESLELIPRLTEERIHSCANVDEIVNLLKRLGCFYAAEREQDDN